MKATPEKTTTLRTKIRIAGIDSFILETNFTIPICPRTSGCQDSRVQCELQPQDDPQGLQPGLHLAIAGHCSDPRRPGCKKCFPQWSG